MNKEPSEEIEPALRWIPRKNWLARLFNRVLIRLHLRKKPEIGFYFARYKLFEKVIEDTQKQPRQ